MKIKRFSYTNHVTGWHLNEMAFGSFTLLVGASGVGKTQILKSLSSLSDIAGGLAVPGREWYIEFEEGGVDYIWDGRFEVSSNAQNLLPFERSEAPIKSESLKAGGMEVFSRDSSQILYNGSPTVKLDTAKSAVELLKEEPDISVVYQAFKKFRWLDLNEGSSLIFPFSNLVKRVPKKRRVY